MLSLLEENDNLVSLKLNYARPSERNVGKLEETLAANKTLKSFEFWYETPFIPALSRIVQGTDCSLEHLGLENIYHGDLSVLLQALQTNTTLTSLYFQFGFTPATRDTWELIYALIRQNKYLTVLKIRIACKDQQFCLDDLASAMAKDTNLTDVKMVETGGNDDAKIDFVCRLFTRRNLIRQMVERQQISAVLWPVIMESMTANPSAMFLAMQYAPWVTC